ncbi:unnamed protein product [Clavelina lepadiformis]|uniref:Major facilitator superfamily (MFS) profile domain-containing protein n=1 Tax=Clavelina lepadiformis TaxID=159417 RepID=A0ABP0FD32_CLALP
MTSSEPLNESQQNGGKVTGNLVLAASMAVIGSNFQFGYNTGVINAPQQVIEKFYNETYESRYGSFIPLTTLDLLWGFTVAVFAVGGMVGSLCASWAAGKFGLKRSMLYNNILAVCAALLMGLSKLAGSFEMLIIGRFIIGVNSGINMGVAPMYLTETAPVSKRGVFGTLGQLGVVSSLLISQVLGLQWVLGTDALWPLLLALTAAFSVFQVLIIPFCPDSPRYTLLVTKDEDKARQDLQWLREKDYDVTEEIEQMKEEHKDDDVAKTSFRELITNPSLYRPLIIAIVMQLSQQLSGINAVFYYSTDIFLEAGIPPLYTGVATVGMGVVNVIMTLVSISLIERAGRRVLHLVGLGGMCASAAVLAVLLNLQRTSAVSWLTLAFILIFVVFFQTGPGAIPWFITAELFDQASRPTAVSIAGLFNWLGNFAVGLAYPPIASAIGGYTFVIFAVFLAFFWIFTFFKVPETKGRSIAEITALFSGEPAMHYTKSTML